MVEASSFEVLAEISFALIGFSGVVVALSHSKLSGTEQAIRLRLLFLSGATALWGGLTPIIGALFSDDIGWLISGLLFAPALLTVNGFAWLRLYRLVRDEGVRLMPKLFYVVTPITVFMNLWLLYTLFFATAQIPAAQFSASTLVLLLGLYHFFVLVTGSFQSET